MKLKRPSPAMIIACIALFAAFSGGAYAAKIKLGKNAVKTKNIKKNAVTSAKIRNGNVKEVDLANGAVSATKLAPGVGGPVAYAHVTNTGAGNSTPVLDASRSNGVTVTAPTGADTGLVCIDVTAPAAKVTTLSAIGENSGPGASTVVEALLPAGNTCPATADALIRTKSETGTDKNANFYVTLF